MSSEVPTRQDLDERVWAWARTPIVYEAFQTVDRKAFMPPGSRNSAYLDRIVPITKDSTVSQPSLVAEMVDNLRLTGEEKVLEIGTGSGYEAAILSLCAREVHSLDYNPRIINLAQKRLCALGYNNVKVYRQDGALGLPNEAPFDAIIVSAGLRGIPDCLIDQLVIGGRIVAPLGKDPNHYQLVIGRKQQEQITLHELKKVYFVPLRSENEGGWSEDLLKKVRDFKLSWANKVLEVEAEESSVSIEDLLKDYCTKLNIGPSQTDFVRNYLSESLELTEEDIKELGI